MTLIDRGDGVRLATRHRPGATPTILFLPGYMSDMRGAKAEHLDAWCAATGRAFLSLDYSGCGASEGAFADGTITRWTADVVAARAAHPGPFVIVGSSMGGWIALRLALSAPVAGLALIAPAPDFTRWGIAATAAERAMLEAEGAFHRPSAYGGHYTYTRALIEDGERNALLDATIAIDAPVRILHGQADPDVPWALSLTLAERLASADVQVTLVKDGDHRLSRPSDLDLLTRTLEALPMEPRRCA